MPRGILNSRNKQEIEKSGWRYKRKSLRNISEKGKLTGDADESRRGVSLSFEFNFSFALITVFAMRI